MERISMKKIKEILRLKYITDISIRAIGRAINIAPSTVSDYCKRFEKAGYTIDKFLEFDEDKIYQLLFPEKCISVIKRQDKPLPNFAYIHKEIAKKGVTFELLWIEYKEQHPNGYEISQFKKLYYKFKNKINPTMRQTYMPAHHEAKRNP
jgi:transposase